MQIDIVATSVQGKEDIIGSCKFRNEKVGVKELEALKKYGEVYSTKTKHHYFIFSKTGFTSSLLARAEAGEVTLVTLEELY